MKKLILITSIFLLLFVFSACGKEEPTKEIIIPDAVISLSGKTPENINNRFASSGYVTTSKNSSEGIAITVTKEQQKHWLCHFRNNLTKLSYSLRAKNYDCKYDRIETKNNYSKLIFCVEDEDNISEDIVNEAMYYAAMYRCFAEESTDIEVDFEEVEVPETKPIEDSSPMLVSSLNQKEK